MTADSGEERNSSLLERARRLRILGHDDYQQVLESVREYVEQREAQIDEEIAKVERRAGL